MAAIVPSDLAPDEQVRYSFAGAEFDLSPGGSYETADRAILVNAESHPWLEVDYPETDAAVAVFRGGSLTPSEDALSAQNSIAFDVESINEVESEKEVALTTPTAIDAGKDQGEEIFAGDGRVAETFAADDVAEERAEERVAEAQARSEEQAERTPQEPVAAVEHNTDTDAQQEG